MPSQSCSPKTRRAPAKSPVFLRVAAILALALLPSYVAAAPPPPPAVNAIVPNFYYDDLSAARRWYIEGLGLTPIYDDSWVVILELGNGMQLALVDGRKGLLKPVKDKGTMLSIETDELDAWYDRVRAVAGTRWFRDHRISADPLPIEHHKDIEEFRVLDPGGYIVEFYRWKPEYRPRPDDREPR